jgi:hypothetical protein
VAIATLVIAAVAVVGTVVNVIIAWWLARKDELARWRRDQLLPCLVKLMFASGDARMAAFRYVFEEATRNDVDQCLEKLARLQVEIELLCSDVLGEVESPLVVGFGGVEGSTNG